MPDTRHARMPLGSFGLSAVLAATFAGYTWLIVNWEPFIRLDHYLNRNYHVQSLWTVLHVVDRIGQRAVCLPILGTVIALTAWRQRSWRPVLLGAVGIFVVNLVVLVAKLAMARGRPLAGGSFFSDGDMYPSGHTANILLVYGLCYYLIAHYSRVSPRVRRALTVTLVVLSVVMLATSMLLRWHWFSDLVGGFLLGGAVLALTVAIDAALSSRAPKLESIPARPDAEIVPVDCLSPCRTPPGSRAGVAGRRSSR